MEIYWYSLLLLLLSFAMLTVAIQLLKRKYYKTATVLVVLMLFTMVGVIPAVLTTETPEEIFESYEEYGEVELLLQK